MSGDVFGNGMLLSEHIRLVAAFDHRHVFLDPIAGCRRVVHGTAAAVRAAALAPGPTTTRSLISAGGGVYPRDAKSVPISAEVREALGIAGDVTALTPHELMHAILMAPVDLLWNGGIGTYVKASTETHADGWRQGERCHSRRRRRAALQGRRRGRQPRPHPARSRRIRPRRRPHQHRRHRQQRRRRHLRPRGEHQDPARSHRRQRRPHRTSSATACSPR